MQQALRFKNTPFLGLWDLTPHFTSPKNCESCFDTVPVKSCPGILAWQIEDRLFMVLKTVKNEISHNIICVDK